MRRRGSVNTLHAGVVSSVEGGTALATADPFLRYNMVGMGVPPSHALDLHHCCPKLKKGSNTERESKLLKESLIFANPQCFTDVLLLFKLMPSHM